MHDIRFIREHPAEFDAALARRNLEPVADDILAVDKGWRTSQTAMQELQSKRNELSKQVGEIKRKGGNADEIMAQVGMLKDKMAAVEDQLPKLAADLELIISAIPNLPAKDVPDGKDEKDNKEIRKSGSPRQIAAPKQHFEIGEKLGLMDFETAAKLSGARFTMLKGPLARLERAIGNFMLDIHTKEFGYTEISPPLMVLDKIMYGTAQLPKFVDDQFAIERVDQHSYRGLADAWEAFGETKPGDGHLELGELARKYPLKVQNAYLSYLQEEEPASKRRALEEFAREVSISADETKSRLWLIPTAEVPLTNIVNDTIVNREELPFRFTAKTPCFRAEAGAAGKDTRGMLRQHQFYKVELVSITTPDQSEKEHERMTECAETILKRLELPFRTMLLCTGDMGFASRKTYDLEVWMPGQNAYREISSCSNCGDFQARRMNARFKATGEKNTEFLHTLNGSGVAVGRCLIAIIENFQEADGSVIIPPALRPYMDGMERIGSGK